eukprot:2659233-Amphidinium_carterae.1
MTANGGVMTFLASIGKGTQVKPGAEEVKPEEAHTPTELADSGDSHDSCSEARCRSSISRLLGAERSQARCEKRQRDQHMRSERSLDLVVWRMVHSFN